MIGYTTLGAKDVTRSAGFYDEIFGALGYIRVFDYPTFVAWGADKGSQFFAISSPNDGKEAANGNGVMIAIEVSDREKIQFVYLKALELGASSEGPPGPRDGSFYCAYIRDLDGNKINFFNRIENS